MSDLIQAVKGTALSVAEYFTPVLKQSKFKQTGVLTPEEFVIAGDHLVHQCPTWSWSSASDPSLSKPYLPADKQYLVTKSVPCYKRCKDIEYCNSDEKVIMTENDDEGWVDTHHSDQESAINEMVDDLIISDEAPVQKIHQNTENDRSGDDDEDDEAEDMDKFMNMVEDDDTVSYLRLPQSLVFATITNYLVPIPINKSVAPSHPNRPDAASNARNATQINTPSNSLSKDANNENTRENIVATRTYDLNITYDKYYQTPRLWLVGYDENLKPLSINDMYQDISQDHAKKTVTMETHPHIPTVMASVHPCRHAVVMKKIISTVEDGGRELHVFSYLIVFLKLVQSVIPTLEYDFTQNFTL